MSKRNRQRPADTPPDSPASGGEWRRSFPFELSKDVTSGQTETKSTDMRYDGHITGVLLGWPKNTDNGAGVQLRNETGETYIPRNSDEESYLAFTNFARVFPVSEAVSDGETITAEFVNNDPDNSHFINCVVFVEEDI
jgi:hypothetical protein